MKPLLRKIDKGVSYSFSIREDISPYFDSRWYYHPEVELTYIRKGRGMRFIGDSIGRFESGDIYLMGSNLPHMWRSDDDYTQGDSDLQVETVVIHFNERFLGEDFLELPEMQSIKKLLLLAKRGIRITGYTNTLLRNKMETVLLAGGAYRVTGLINMLESIAVSQVYELLASIGFTQSEANFRSDYIKRIYEYTFDNFQDEISIKSVASVARISPNYFCRFFKSQTSKTYWQFLREVKIGYACKLIMDGKMTISEIGYECGFNNPSNFNRQFKAVVRKTPLEYRREYLQLHLPGKGELVSLKDAPSNKGRHMQVV